jgi:hypothetical protein
MRCDACGDTCPTKHVTFYQNIGMVIMRSSKTVEGDLCKACIDRVFWRFTMVTLVFGWWGMISLVVTPLFLINNIARFLGTLSMKSAGTLAAAKPHPTRSLTPAARERLMPFRDEMRDRIAQGEPEEAVCENVARKAGVSAHQAELMIDELE